MIFDFIRLSDRKVKIGDLGPSRGWRDAARKVNKAKRVVRFCFLPTPLWELNLYTMSCISEISQVIGDNPMTPKSSRRHHYGKWIWLQSAVLIKNKGRTIAWLEQQDLPSSPERIAKAVAEDNLLKRVQKRHQEKLESTVRYENATKIVDEIKEEGSKLDD